MNAMAAHKNQTTINLRESAQLGSAMLAPGEYSLSWSGMGNNGTATLSRGKTVLVMVPARMVEQRSPYSSPAVSTSSAEGGAPRITEIQLPKLELYFDNKNESSMR
jgi:hypothetical protein